jgi:(S)-2-hydroxyglutarate dehydrogenase
LSPERFNALHLDWGPLDGHYDIAIIGGGILGLATAHRLKSVRPDLRLAIVEKEGQLATHQSGRNSGVLHAGVYYAPGSLKARLCREGKAALESYCDTKGIRYDRCGKVIVALTEAEIPRLRGLHDRATANDVPVEEVGPERIRELEPHVNGLLGLWSPTTGIVDFRAVALALADDLRRDGVEFHLGHRVTAIRRHPRGLELAGPMGGLSTRYLIACAGLWADAVSAMTSEPGPRIVPFRGDYYTLLPQARHLVRGLIYPVPDPRFPFLGVHFTRRIDGEVWAGPNAVLAFAREGYRRSNISLRDLARTLTYPGFLRLARRYWRTGLAEMRRDYSKRAFLRELQRFVPELRGGDIVFGPSGIRAQALARDGKLLDDFELTASERVLHVMNAPSPAATSSLAIGRELAERAIERFDLAK